VDALLEEGKYDEVQKWLKEHIHHYGFRYEAPEIMRLSTGRDFDVNVYLDYLEKKYTELYKL